MPKFIVQSRYPAGSFNWALDQLDGGNQMRRPHWPYRAVNYHSGAGQEYQPIFIFKHGRENIMLGFSTGSIGDDYTETYIGLGTPSMNYAPRDADMEATDWKNVDHFDEAERAAVPVWQIAPSWGDTEDTVRIAAREAERAMWRRGAVLFAILFALAAAVAINAWPTKPKPDRYGCTVAQQMPNGDCP